jgi:PAS domain S-box-containing protein
MSSPSLTLLIIEDFLADRELYQRYLQADTSCTYQLLTADCAKAGLELCQTAVIDGILLDYVLPDSDGLSFLAALVAQCQGAPPPVVMVTGKGNEVIAAQAIKLGAADYLVKHYLTPERLQLSIRSAIENAQLRQQLLEDRRRAAQKLQESEERLLLGIQVAGVALARFDYATNSVELSLEAAALYGIPANELKITRERIHNTFHPEDREILMPIIEQVLDPTGAGWFAFEHRVVWPDGTVHWLSVRKQVFFDRSGAVPRPDYAILAAIDITAQKQADLERTRLLAEAEAARAEAEAANRSKDELVTIVAHELRSPLNSVLGWARILQNQPTDAETQRKALDTIVRNTHAQVQLIEDLLDMSRMVRGTLQLDHAPVNLVQVSEMALNIVRPMAEAKQIDTATQFTEVPQIMGDSNRLQQIMVNLLTNAIKFTPAQGQIDLQLAQVGEQVQLCIRDTGKGIAPERLPFIFERFHQGQQTIGAKGGLGLGLAIVKHLVELHHGTITAESPGINQGATFTICLPQLKLVGSEQTQMEEAMISQKTSLTGVRVLVVDDEPDMLNLIQFVLQSHAADVQAFTIATAALDCLANFQPDLLVSDLAMPDLDGYTLVQQMRSHPNGQIPVIMLTAYGNTGHQEQALQLGIQRYLTKPIDPNDLVNAVLNLVQNPSP